MPRLLDLFCGAGGAAMGYHRAGFEVVGVDIKPQPHYPFEFWQMDALDADLDGFDVIHASPPCQLFTRAGHLRAAKGGKPSSPDLVEPTRTLLRLSGLPYVIENVEGAPIEGVSICGSSFGLGVRRHRIFESNLLLFGAPCRHREQGRPVGVYYRPGWAFGAKGGVPLEDREGGRKYSGRTAETVEEAQVALGIDWMPEWNELKEAIPPAYTEWIGHQLMRYLEAAA